jgi:hypothetical protein
MVSMKDSIGSAVSRARVLFVDAHVHIYDVYDLDVLFDSAIANFARAANKTGFASVPREHMLLLTETERDHAFDALASGARVPRVWKVAATQESAVLRVSRDPQTAIWLVAGRQIATREDLEVLALGTTRRFPDKEPIQVSLQASEASAALTALPWGFGKWWGARGGIIEKIMQSPRDQPIFLGDNGGRLSMSTRPRLFAVGERSGLKVLPGTDPLPFRGQESRVGSFGMLLPDWTPGEHPLAQFVERLQRAPATPREFGGLTGIVPFVKLQIAMQLRKRRGSAA